MEIQYTTICYYTLGMTVDDKEWNMVDLAVYILSKELVTENLW